jgi:hypothetical protein
VNVCEDLEFAMAETFDPEEFVVLEEPAFLNMWKIGPIMELLERKRLLPKGKG